MGTPRPDPSDLQCLEQDAGAVPNGAGDRSTRVRQRRATLRVRVNVALLPARSVTVSVTRRFPDFL